VTPATSQSASFIGADDNALVADRFGEGGPVALLLHGGGQTRHAWRKTAVRLAGSEWVVYALDQRGHGESAWTANYDFNDFAADATCVADALTARHGTRPVAVGASLGGIAALIAEGAAREQGRGGVFGGLVLVDITPRVDPNGVDKVRGFMREHAHAGFATVHAAADAVAAYLPHRPRPRSLEGLKKNLRLHPDGRWRWHWDPRFLDGPRALGAHRGETEDALVRAARTVEVPALLVRGGSSELVNEAHAREFLELVPHAEYVDVSGARHMVAGDQNDDFAAAILGFLSRIKGDSRGSEGGLAAVPGARR
jgi:pimeloyl-ACP methyl ester carboxylesterase